jgi:Acetyltransferase (GNAT) family.
MDKKLTKFELKDLLTKRNDRKYTYDLNILCNVGNPDLAVTDMYSYSIDNDIVIVSMYWFGGCQLYFEISDFNNLKYFYAEVEKSMNDAKEILLSSDSETLFDNPEFKRLFGEHDIKMSEQYGMFNLEKAHKSDEQIRILTVEDENIILSFAEPFQQYHDNLRNAYETRIKTFDKNYLIYSYIENGTDILGYLIANTLNGEYWDIAYIYVAENARGKGIAKKLASYYANDIITKGSFASYGTPENVISKKVAVSAGFEMFVSTYSTQWISK